MSSLDPVLARVGFPGPGLLDGAALLEQIVLLLGSADRHRGLIPVLQGFERHGLGYLASSWVGTGRNLPISPRQMEQALDEGLVRQLAGAAGMSERAAIVALCALLPGVIDRITPSGEVAPGPDRRAPLPVAIVMAR